MKKSIVAILGIGILLYPLICFSSYIIHLKDGREFATDRYYEEGDQIKFKRYGGVIGIEKDLVREIEEMEWGSYQAKRVIRQDKPEKWWSFLALECPFWG